MTVPRSIPRRGALGWSLATLLIPLAPATRAAAQQKLTKMVAKYQDHPNGQQRCEICLQFEPPDKCHLVEGEISPYGWCQFFAAKDNAH